MGGLEKGQNLDYVIFEWSPSSDGNVEQLNEPIHGFVDDYAFLIQGLLDLYHATFDEKWIKWADQLQNKQNQLFWDEKGK